jgi:hypothetical protein
MQANELRIGNLISLPIFSGDPALFTEKICADFGYAPIRVSLTLLRDAEYYKDNWAGKPIPLTEEWLMKFGFAKRNKKHPTPPKFRYKDTAICCYWDGVDWCFKYGTDADLSFACCQFVHQLQNLYFALAGEELILSQETTSD